MNETENQGQMQFSFCQSCGSYIQAEQVKVVCRQGVPFTLCPDCAGKVRPVVSKDEPITTAEEFERKYNL